MFNAKIVDWNNHPSKEDVYRELQEWEGCAAP